MAQPRNEEARKKVHHLIRELEGKRTIGDPSLAHQIAEKAGLSYQMALYYIRMEKEGQPGFKDSRRAYTVKQLAHMDLMTTQELKGYANHLGRSYRALHEAVLRYRKNIQDFMRSKERISDDENFKILVEQQYFNFSSAADLSSVGCTKADVENAKNHLKSPWGLGLRAPNLLYHPSTKRVYAMTIQQQKHLLTNPKSFLSTYREAIKNGWVERDRDPVADLDLISEADSVYLTARTRRSKEKSLLYEALTLARKLTKLLPDIERKELLQKGNSAFQEFATLEIYLISALKHSRKEFDINDPSTYRDLTGQPVKTQAQLDDELRASLGVKSLGDDAPVVIGDKILEKDGGVVTRKELEGMGFTRLRSGELPTRSELEKAGIDMAPVTAQEIIEMTKAPEIEDDYDPEKIEAWKYENIEGDEPAPPADVANEVIVEDDDSELLKVLGVLDEQPAGNPADQEDSEDEPVSPDGPESDDEDSWMKDFKPVSAAIEELKEGE